MLLGNSPPLPPPVHLGQTSVNDVHDNDLITSALANGAYTVRFTTNFRRPVRTPQVVLVRGRVVKREGRKLHLRGSMEDKNGKSFFPSFFLSPFSSVFLVTRKKRDG